MHVVPIGVDSETKRGAPITFQWYSEQPGVRSVIQWVKAKHATRFFFQYLDSLPSAQHRNYVVFGHNLSFDLVSFFHDRHSILRNESVEAEWFGWTVNIVFAAVRFASFKKGKKNVMLIDTGAYFVRKLESIAEMVCPDLPKLKMPEGLGQKDFTPKDKEFCAYAMRDSVIAYHAGVQILKIHEEMDCSIAVSAPHFASKVFRRHFLKTPIPLPPRKVVYSALASYHGGKNGVTIPAGFYRGVHCLDIKSAYPYAMSTFPSFTNPSLYRSISGNTHPKTKLPDYGIYRISGESRECKWPVLFDHGFKPVSGRAFDGIWTTGFELNEGIRSKELRIESLTGYYYQAELDHEPSAFKGYVETFYKRKESEKSTIRREFWKLLLNSLYGKFIQTRQMAFCDLVFDLDDNRLIADNSLTAGGLFNPFIATLITGHTRAYIHRLEHKYNALHTSTDGVQTQKKISRRGLLLHGKPGALGSVSVESSGDALILRNKLYVIYGGKNHTGKAKTSAIYPDRTILKYALHGFHGTVETLEHLWKSGIREYEYLKVNKLRESLRRNLTVNDFVTNKATLKLKNEQR